MTAVYEWDESKSEITRQRRGFGFEIVKSFMWDYALCTEIQHVEFEEREQWIGPIDNRLYVLITVQRELVIRVVSLRQATQQEIAFWRKEISDA